MLVRNRWIFSGWTISRVWILQFRKNPLETLCSRVQDQEARKGATSTPCVATVRSDATFGFAEDPFVTHDERWVEQTRTSLDAETLPHQSSAFHGDSTAPDLRDAPSRGSPSARRGQVGQTVALHVRHTGCVAHPGSWRLTWCAVQKACFRRGKHRAAWFMNTMEDIRMSAHGDDFVVLADDLVLEHMDKLLTGKCTAKNPGTLGSQEGCVSELQLLNRSIRCGRDDREELHRH